MSLGPVMVGVEGLELTAEDRELLSHPLVGGVILFTRNYRSFGQLRRLTEAVHALRKPRLLIAVDHEGGRVQRFRDGFTRLPAVGNLGVLYQSDPVKALRMARMSGWLMAIELRAAGVDLSFAPVLDLGLDVSGAVGDRAFHRDPEVVAELGRAYMVGMRRAGMEATGKHFPGHGSVVADSHLELPVDERDLEDISRTDLVPFERLAHYGIAAFMAAHVVYPRVDPQPAGFSRIWLTEVLRERIGFQGLIFTDDLDMAAAAVAGAPEERARIALEAGCDMVLACNDRPSMVRIVDGLGDFDDPVAHLRLARMHGRGRPTPERLAHSGSWRKAAKQVREYDQSPLLDMDL
jgi:beta-N-acetylhexosaminidase